MIAFRPRTPSAALSYGALALGIVLALPLAAQNVVQERVDLDAVQRIREEGLTRSRIDSLAGYLNDVIGPRLTGSSGMRRANEWTAEMFRAWGLANVRVEPWGRFGRGWERVSYSGRILEPFIQPLNAQPLAWGGSTRGPVTGPAVLLEVQDTADLARYRGRLRGAFVLRAAPAEIGPEFEPRTRRAPLEQLFDTTRQRPMGPPQFTPEQRARLMAEQALGRRIFDFLQAEQPAALLQPSGWTYGMLLVQGMPSAFLARDSALDPVPGLLVSHEQYGQIYRNLRRGVPVRLEVNVQNRFLAQDLQAYNTLAEIPGTDLAGQVVMLGAHLDSWHSGTGATDNGAGSVVMMEAVRILKALGTPMRRTVRIALWSGEEQGLLGSRAWIAANQGEWPRISAYVNVDNGTGRIRGIWNQSNEAAVPIFEQILFPFRDLGVMAVRRGNTGGTDHLSFDAVGIPGFNFIQDPIEYGFRTHHSNADTYERLVIDDLKQAATVVAWTVYHLANRDDLMPRKPPAARASGGN